MYTRLSMRGLNQAVHLRPEGFKGAYRGTSLIRNRAPLATYIMTMPRGLWWF